MNIKGLGGEYQVFHHTEFIKELLEHGKLSIKGDLKGKRITYHDPCYLGIKIMYMISLEN